MRTLKSKRVAIAEDIYSLLKRESKRIGKPMTEVLEDILALCLPVYRGNDAEVRCVLCSKRLSDNEIAGRHVCAA